MSLRALGDDRGSADALQKSYELNPTNPDTGREYAAARLALGHGDEAVRVARHVLGLCPDDPGLRANLALAQLVAGQVREAAQTVNEALEQAPDDAITRNLRSYIERVESGEIPCPSRFPF